MFTIIPLLAPYHKFFLKLNDFIRKVGRAISKNMKGSHIHVKLIDFIRKVGRAISKIDILNGKVDNFI